MTSLASEKVRKMRHRAEVRKSAPPIKEKEPPNAQGSDPWLRVGCELLAGDGWIRQTLISTPWPLAVVRVGTESIGVTSPVFGAVTTVAWEDVVELRQKILGVSLRYVQDGSKRELILYRPFLWSRLQEFARTKGFVLPGED